MSPKMRPGFHHVAIRVRNFDETLKFYSEGFGFVRKYGWGEGDKRAALLDTGDGNYLEVFAGGTHAAAEDLPEGYFIHIALRTDDVDRDFARAIAAGAREHTPPKDVPIQGDHVVNVRLAFVRGLDGEVIEFFSNDEL